MTLVLCAFWASMLLPLVESKRMCTTAQQMSLQISPTAKGSTAVGLGTSTRNDDPAMLRKYFLERYPQSESLQNFLQYEITSEMSTLIYRHKKTGIHVLAEPFDLCGPGHGYINCTPVFKYMQVSDFFLVVVIRYQIF